MSMPQDCPVGPRKRRAKRAGLEGPVVRECLKLLHDDPRVVYVERRNNGAVQFDDGGFVRFGSKGAADIFCICKIPVYVFEPLPRVQIEHKDGQNYVCEASSASPIEDGDIIGHYVPVHYRLAHVEIECKRSDGKGRQSAVQKEFQEFCDNQGIPYILVKSTTELKIELNRLLG